MPLAKRRASVWHSTGDGTLRHFSEAGYRGLRAIERRQARREFDPGTERLTQIIDQFCAFPASLGNEGRHYKLQSLRTPKPSSTDPPQRSNGLEPNIAKLDDDALELEGDRAGAYGDFLDVILQDAVHVHLDGIAAAEDIVGIHSPKGFSACGPVGFARFLPQISGALGMSTLVAMSWPASPA